MKCREYVRGDCIECFVEYEISEGICFEKTKYRLLS